MGVRFRVACALVLVGNLNPQGEARAEAIDTASADDLDQVVINGHKDIDSAGQVSITANAGLLGNRDQFNTPFSQASYTDELILDQQARTLDEVLDNNSSIRDTANSYSDAEQINIRGFSSQPQSVLFAGVPGLLGSRRPSVEGVERVDILLGPSALLYNGVSDQNVGGVINVQPKRAGNDPLTRIIVSYVSSSSVEAQADVSRRFGPDGLLGVRANLAGMNGATPIDNQSQHLGFGSLGLDLRSERLTASVDVTGSSYRLLANVANLHPLADAPVPSPPDASTNVFDDSSKYIEKNLLVLTKADYRLLPWLTLGAAYGHSHFTEDYSGPYFLRLTDDTGNAAVNVIPFFARNSVDVGQVSARAKFNTGLITHEAVLSGDFYSTRGGSAFEFLQALDTNIYAPIALRSRITSNPLPDENIGDSSRSRRNSVALADVMTLFAERLTLIAGLRRQSIDDSNLDPTTGEVTSEYRKSAVTPAGAVVFKIVPRISLYANYIQALQSGPTAPNLVTNAGEVFPPYRAKQYEAGIKWDLRGLGLTAAVFQITQPSSYIDSRSNLFVINGEARNRGVELNAFGSLSPGLRLLSGLSYFDAVQVRTGDAATDGKLAIAIPHVQANLGAEWDVPQAAGLTLTARAIYTSKEYVDAVNSQSIPDWTRIDLGARYRFNLAGYNTTLRFDVRNLAGRNYWQDASQGLLYEGAPRTFRASLMTDF